MSKPRVLLYLRVSDPSQVNNHSLATQEKICRQYAEAQSWEVVGCFKDEGVSAKHVQTRPALRELIKFSTQKKNKVDFVLVYKFDRWTRNLAEGLEAEGLLVKSGVILVSATESTAETPAGQFLKNMLMVMAEFDNSLKSEKVKDNMQAAFRKGLWVWRCPVGYKRKYPTKEQNKNIPPVLDEKVAPMIKEMVEFAATGLYSKQQLANQLNSLGYKEATGYVANVNTITSILKNTFYYGLMYSKTWGEYQQGLHKPLVSEEVWNRANVAVIKTKKKGKQFQDLGLFPLKGSIKCDECGGNMTSSNPTGNGGKYHYYECHAKGCSKTRIGIEEAHQQFEELLASFKPKDIVLKLYEEMVFKEWDKQVNVVRKQMQQLDKKVKELEAEPKKIRVANEKGIYTDEQAKEEAERVRTELVVLKMERSDLQLFEYDQELVKSFFKFFVLNLDRLWLVSDLPKKQALQTKLFPEGVVCTKEKTIRTKKVAAALEAIESISDSDSSWVSPPGIEPGSSA